MDTVSNGGEGRSAEAWRQVLAAGLLASILPEEIFVACLELDRDTEPDLVGELMGDLAERATRFLRRRVSPGHPNRGDDIILGTVEKLQDALLVPGHSDVTGYSSGFYAKLAVRLADQIRKSRRRATREIVIEIDEDGDEIQFPDLTGLSPDKAVEMGELLHDVDAKKRQALALYACGYRAYSDDPDIVTVGSLLGVSRKTAETWVREMKQLVSERIKR